MKFVGIIVVFALVTLTCGGKDDAPKVRIGIKKRVEDCKEKAHKGDLVHVHYRGTLQADGSEFDSSYGRGDPFSFTLGMSQVIKGWDQGLLGMCVGESRRLVIPPELGYGASGAGAKIPPNSVLIFEVDLVKIQRRDDL